MNTALFFGTTAVLTVTGAASLPFVMHRLEGGLARRDADAVPAEASGVPVEAPGLPQPDVA